MLISRHWLLRSLAGRRDKVAEVSKSSTLERSSHNVMINRWLAVTMLRSAYRVSIIGSSNDSVVLTLDTTSDAKHSQHIQLVDRFRSLLLSFHTYLFAYLVITGATFKFDESSGISRVSENQKSKTVFIFDLFLHINKLLQSSRVVTIFANLTQAGRCMHFFQRNLLLDWRRNSFPSTSPISMGSERKLPNQVPEK